MTADRARWYQLHRLAAGERVHEVGQVACGGGGASPRTGLGELTWGMVAPSPQTTMLLDPAVAEAFGVDRQATLLPNGLDQRTFRSGNVVLRRLGDDAHEEAHWTAELFARLHQRGFRVPTPIRPHQLIHGDLNPDNILIAPDGSGLPPGIIDMTPYWRPAGYAAAVAAYWLGPYRGDATVLEHFAHVPHFPQLLVRAALRMLLTFRDPQDVGDVQDDQRAIDVIAAYVR